jgi:hypothetical protein
MAAHLPSLLQCPVCKGHPDIGVCEGWPKDCGPAPWYATCYKRGPIEHCLGGNGDNQRDAMEVWNKAVRDYRAVGQGGLKP